ncbi:MAG: menaquinone biosynthesis protein [Planctomycetes bacterium]|nr:menaquinone biosynthesis protein [Planctomycetota bacterium]
MRSLMRIGAVNYLNSKPLVCGLEALAPDVRLTYDLPSRLADSLSAGRLDVALVPSVEFFRSPRYRIVSDACVACRGPVLSVKLHFRVPPREVQCVALDEGSRTSAALTQILLAERIGVRPRWEPLAIGCGVEATGADAVLLIGDRAIKSGEPPRGYPAGSREQEESSFCEVWDLGEAWTEWTDLPFVFAMWIAREGVNVSEMGGLLEAARDRGLTQLDQIAEREADAIGISRKLATRYLRDNLHFTLGREERAGLRKFYELCVAHELAPRGLGNRLDELFAADSRSC